MRKNPLFWPFTRKRQKIPENQQFETVASYEKERKKIEH